MTKRDVITCAYLYLMDRKAQAETDYAAFHRQAEADRDPETEILWKLTLEEIYEDFCQLARLMQHPDEWPDLPDGCSPPLETH